MVHPRVGGETSNAPSAPAHKTRRQLFFGVTSRRTDRTEGRSRGRPGSLPRSHRRPRSAAPCRCRAADRREARPTGPVDARSRWSMLRPRQPSRRASSPRAAWARRGPCRRPCSDTRRHRTDSSNHDLQDLVPDAFAVGSSSARRRRGDRVSCATCGTLAFKSRRYSST